MDPDSALPVAQLAQRCSEEMDRYQRQQRYDPRYCYELFHCALVQRDEEAWIALYSQYHRLVLRWLGNVPGDPDALVNRAFERFWQALSPDRFADFPALDGILGYLRRCARCVAIDAGRREERRSVREISFERLQELGIEEDRASSMERMLDEITAEQLYEWVVKHLNSSKERLVFRASFEWDLRPGAIAKRWPDLFTSAREVSRIKEYIIRRLQRDERLRCFSGTDDTHSDNIHGGKS